MRTGEASLAREHSALLYANTMGTCLNTSLGLIDFNHVRCRVLCVCFEFLNTSDVGMCSVRVCLGHVTSLTGRRTRGTDMSLATSAHSSTRMHTRASSSWQYDLIS